MLIRQVLTAPQHVASEAVRHALLLPTKTTVPATKHHYPVRAVMVYCPDSVALYSATSMCHRLDAFLTKQSRVGGHSDTHERRNSPYTIAGIRTHRALAAMPAARGRKAGSCSNSSPATNDLNHSGLVPTCPLMHVTSDNKTYSATRHPFVRACGTCISAVAVRGCQFMEGMAQHGHCCSTLACGACM
jgi:hypothetical protein